MDKLRVGIIGATGTVGQRYIDLLRNHAWFNPVLVAASASSAGKTYRDAVAGRWGFQADVPENAAGLKIIDAKDIKAIASACDFVFCAVDLPKGELAAYEESLAQAEIPVVSSNSAHRFTRDVPVLIPEINSSHLSLIDFQKKRLGTKTGFIAVKPNCSVQSWIIPIYALELAGFAVKGLHITNLQAVSGAGRPGVSSLDSIDNVIPFISGEEEKTEKEPLRIFGTVNPDRQAIDERTGLGIQAFCTRVPVLDGHLSCVSATFAKNAPSLDEAANVMAAFDAGLAKEGLPSAPSPVVIVRSESDRPQPRLDRDAGNGMAISVGRLRNMNDGALGFVGLSHNTLRGAAGGGVLNAELLVSRGYIAKKSG